MEKTHITVVHYDSVSIVLSPHYDDAVLSLGGMLATHSGKEVVATFFTGLPHSHATTQWDARSGFLDSDFAVETRKKENERALAIFNADAINYGYLDYQYRHNESESESDLELEKEITSDIQALISSYGTTTKIFLYAPAVYPSSIAHADHTVVHNAFIDVMQSYPNSNVTFYVYEDFPYVQRYSEYAMHSLEKYLEDADSILVTEINMPLSEINILEKQKALAEYSSQVMPLSESVKKNIIQDDIEYTKKRCGSNACEVVYKIIKF
jgi:LmbE family N-acetylglucosaminyl deacetylase